MNQVKYSNFKERIIFQRPYYAQFQEYWESILECWAYVSIYKEKRKPIDALKEVQPQYYILVRKNLNIDSSMRIKYKAETFIIDSILSQEKHNFIAILARKN